MSINLDSSEGSINFDDKALFEKRKSTDEFSLYEKSSKKPLRISDAQRNSDMLTTPILEVEDESIGSRALSKGDTGHEYDPGNLSSLYRIKRSSD